MQLLKSVRFNHKFWFSFLLIIIFVLGIYFRFANLENRVYWHDEVYTRFHLAGYQPPEWKSALFNGKIIGIEDIQKYQTLDPEKSLKSVLQVLAIYDPHHPPFYYIIARFWVQLFGNSVAILRSFSAFMSLLTLPIIYYLCLELFTSSVVGLWAIALFSLSPFFILYAQEARPYALWTLIILLSNWTFLRAIRISEQKVVNSAKYLAWAFYGLTLSIGFYTSLFTVLVVIIHGIYAVIYKSLTLTKVVIYYGLTVILSLLSFIPWIIVFIVNYEQYKISTNWARFIKIPPLDIVKNLGLNISRIFADFGGEFAQPLTCLMIISFLGIVGYSIYIICSTSPRKIWSFTLCLIFVPIVLLVIPDLIVGGVRSLSSRYLIPSWIGIILAVAYLLVNQFNYQRKITPVIMIFVVSMGIISSSLNLHKDTAWNKVISYSLPEVARIINKADYPLLVGNNISYNPGNIIALSYLLKPEVKLQLLSSDAGYILPQAFTEIFLLSPSDELRDKLEQEDGVKVEWVFGDNHLWLWKVNL